MGILKEKPWPIQEESMAQDEKNQLYVTTVFKGCKCTSQHMKFSSNALINPNSGGLGSASTKPQG